MEPGMEGNQKGRRTTAVSSYAEEFLLGRVNRSQSRSEGITWRQCSHTPPYRGPIASELPEGDDSMCPIDSNVRR